MREEERLVEETCRKFLSASHLRDICRYRGFSPSHGDKDSLASFVSARFLEPVGVREAMLSLEEPYAFVLHLVALSETPTYVRDIGRILHPSAQRYSSFDEREVFGKLALGLLNRGIMLARDTSHIRYPGESRFARVQLLIPEAYRAFLPPFPVTSVPLGEVQGTQDPASFCRRALALAVRRTGGWRRDEAAKGILERTAALFSFRDGTISVDGSTPSGSDAMVRRVREAWIGCAVTGKPRKSKPAFVAATHILSSLEAGQGCTLSVLERGLARLGLEVDGDELTWFCRDGHGAGFLSRGGTQDAPCYAALVDGRALDSELTLAFSAERGEVRLDLDRSGLDGILEACQFSQAIVEGGTMRLVPDIVRMGRLVARLDTSSVLMQLRRASTGFDEAARHVLARRGKLILHEGLVVLRVDDLGLRTQLLHSFSGRLRILSGPYVAVVRGLAEQVEAYARKQGFSPRRIS